MGRRIKDIEQEIIQQTDSEFGKKYNLILQLSDIDEIPFDNYSELQETIHSGKIIMRKTSLRMSAFTLLSTLLERILLYTLGSVLVAPIGVILAWVFSWWFLILILYPFIIGNRIGQKIYMHTIFNSALSSEKIFCYLYCLHVITLQVPGQRLIARQLGS